MSSTYSTNLALELIGTGDQAGTWGNTTNTNLGTLIEQAISGYVAQAVATGTDTTITIPNGSSGVARNMYIELTGTGGTNTNLIVPANKKLYFIYNNSTGAVTVKVSGQTGISVPQGKKVVLTSNGTDVVNGLNYIADFGSNSATITQLSATSATITNLTLTSLVISNLSIASANITTLTSTNATAASLTVSTGNLTFSSTAQRITGDMSNATIANRLAFQTSTTNGNTDLQIIPNGTSVTSGIRLNNNSDTTNAGYVRMSLNSSEATIAVDRNSVSGTYLPLLFNTSGSEAARVTTTRNLLVGTTTDISGRSGVISDAIGNVRDIPSVGAAKTSTYTLAITDIGEFVTLGTSGAIDVPNGIFSAGNAVSIFNNTSSNATISLTITTAYIGGTDTDKASVTLATRGITTILFISNSVCVLTGNVS